MVIHHVEVDHVGTRFEDGVDLFPQARKISGEDGGRDKKIVHQQ
jgi:hypothetical protein